MTDTDTTEHDRALPGAAAAGAAPGIPDGDGVTALAHAERRGFSRIAGLLRAVR